MKQDFTVELTADNNFSVLNRIINILNRRRVRIKKMMVHENENDIRRGGLIMLVFTSPDLMEKVVAQLEKLIEVDSVNVYQGNSEYFELSEKIVDVD
jgi:acetolactate synthase regulatory subunit